MTYFFQIDRSPLTIDGTNIGNEARFFNHSCAPNMAVFHVKHFVLKYEILAFFAIEDIEEGQELTWDYNLKGKSDCIGKPCDCGATACKGEDI